MAASSVEDESEGYRTELQGWLIAVTSVDAERVSNSEMNLSSADKLKQVEIGELFKTSKSLIKARPSQLCCKRLYLGVGLPTELFVVLL